MRGLVNLGNTCFLNAVLQCLAYTPAFGKFLATLEPAEMHNKRHSANASLQSQQVSTLVVVHLQRVLAALTSTDPALARYPTVSPDSLLTVLRQACPDLFPAGGQQQDAHELLVRLLDIVNRTTSVPRRAALHFKGGQMSPERMAMERRAFDAYVAVFRSPRDPAPVMMYSLLHEMFFARVHRAIECAEDGCRHVEDVFDHVDTLSLPIPDWATTLVDCFRGAFQLTQKLEHGNEWTCPACRRPTLATVRARLWFLPKYLVVHLVRFVRRGTGWDKDSRRLDVPAALDLTEFLSPYHRRDTARYALYAAVQHLGQSMDAGHYIASCHTVNAQRAWSEFNDTTVQTVEPGHLKETPYLLFYVHEN